MSRTSKYDADKANLQRLKVNKINLVQSLKVDDDLLTNLMKQRIIYFKEATDIMELNKRDERAKCLIECLLTKAHTRKDWYTQFRNCLLERNYKDLVIFLDNTIIEKPKFAAKITSQQQQQQQLQNHSGNFSLYTDSLATISENNFDLNNQQQQQQKRDFTSIYRSFNQNFKNVNILDEKSLNSLIQTIQTYSDPPYGIFNELEYSNDADDATQLIHENECYLTFKKFELFYSLYVAEARETFKDLFFIDNFIVFNLLSSKNWHLFMKYYGYLILRYNVDLLGFLVFAFIEKLRQVVNEKLFVLNLKSFKSLDELTAKLVNELMRNERLDNAKFCLLEYLTFLDKCEEEMKNKDEKFELGLSKFLALENLCLVNNCLLEYKEFQANFSRAEAILSALSDKDKKMINFSRYFFIIGSKCFEEGNFIESFKYLNKSLLDVKYEDDFLIDLIGAVSLCYAARWKIAKAETLAILCIQAAKHIYGKNHAQFVKALLFYCNFCNEFIQDKSCIEIADYTLKLAKKVYGTDTVAIADTYRVLSKALIINKMFKEDLYYEYVQRALKIVQDYYPQNSPKFIPYQISLISALQWKSINADLIEVKKVNINDAYSQAIQVLKTSTSVFGENNLATAKIYRLIGSILYYMERDQDSELSHKNSLEIFKVCLPKNDLHYLLAKSTYGVFHKMIGKINEAILILNEVVNNIRLEELNSIIAYCRWIPSIYSNLGECYRINKMDELADYYQKQADNLKIVASQKAHLKHDILSVEMHRSPPANLNEFFVEFLKS